LKIFFISKDTIIKQFSLVQSINISYFIISSLCKGDFAIFFYIFFERVPLPVFLEI